MKNWTVIAFYKGERQIVADHIGARSAERAFKKQLKEHKRRKNQDPDDLVQIVAIEGALSGGKECHYADVNGGQV